MKKNFRLENGFGSVVKLSGRRRRPYVAKTATQGYTEKGYPIRQTLGYFEKWQDAYNCLLEYNKNPYTVTNKNTTFADVYELYVKQREASPQGWLASSKKMYRSSFLMCQPLHNVPIQDIKATHLQSLIDDLTTKYKPATLNGTKILLNQVFKFAEENDIIQKNYAKFVSIKAEKTSEHHQPFSPAELEKLWSCVGKVKGAEVILVMCYTGFRVSAYKNLKINLEEDYLQGGVKTKAGKNRIVPIHHRIKPLIISLLETGGLFDLADDTVRDHFPKILKACGIDTNHTPHSCRATLATELQRADAKDLYIKRILGHTSNDITHDVYTAVDIQQLRETIELLP